MPLKEKLSTNGEKMLSIFLIFSILSLKREKPRPKIRLYMRSLGYLFPYIGSVGPNTFINESTQLERF